MKALLIPILLFAVSTLCHPAHARLFQADNGDCRLIGIHLERQISRSHCAPATLAGVLNYYHVKSDQKTLAQLIGWDPNTGTDVESMLEILARSSSILHLEIEALLDFDYQRYQKTILAYNQKALAQNAPRLWLNPTGTLDLEKTFGQAQIEILKSVQPKKQQRAFFQSVTSAIQSEDPLLWGIILGIAPEPELAPYRRGGHLRLIIGYNRKTQEILYADPWGNGHQLKRMPVTDAQAITMSLHRLKRIPHTRPAPAQSH